MEPNKITKTRGFAGRKLRAEQFTRDGFEEDVEMVRVLKEFSQKTKGLDGEVRENFTMSRVSEMPKEHAHDVLLALAEFYDYELSPK